MKGKEVIEKIREFVKEECEKQGSKYPYAYEFHFKDTVKWANKLADLKDVNKEVVEIAAWLHDIGSIVVGRENHHITGSEIAEKKLIEFNYPKEKIEKIKHCIFVHRGSLDIPKQSEEARIIAEADSMSHFEEIDGLFLMAFIHEGLPRKEARESVKEHFINSYNKLSEEGRNLVKNKLDAAMLLLSD